MAVGDGVENLSSQKQVLKLFNLTLPVMEYCKKLNIKISIIYTVNSCYNDTEYQVRYHLCTQYIVVYDFRYNKRYLQIYIDSLGDERCVRCLMCLHGGDQRFGRWMKNAVLTEIFRKCSLICYP